MSLKRKESPSDVKSVSSVGKIHKVDRTQQQQSHIPSLTVARFQYAIGHFYETQGNNCPRAMRWYHKAARNRRLTNAAFALARCYSKFYARYQDWRQAVAWFTQAAQGGHADAQCQLGIIYHEGRKEYEDVKQGEEYEEKESVAVDTSKALQWFMASASQGHAEAQFRLGQLYVERATAWWTKAADQDYLPAKKGLITMHGQHLVDIEYCYPKRKNPEFNISWHLLSRCIAKDDEVFGTFLKRIFQEGGRLESTVEEKIPLLNEGFFEYQVVHSHAYFLPGQTLRKTCRQVFPRGGSQFSTVKITFQRRTIRTKPLHPEMVDIPLI